MGIAERAALIQANNGCALCTDWTGTHNKDNCDAKTKSGGSLSTCDVSVGGGTCGKKHHRLLHGSKVQYCNKIDSKNVTEISNSEDRLANDEVLLKMMWAEFKGDKVNMGLVFFDDGSTLGLVRKKFVEMLGIKGRECVQWVQPATKDWEEWRTVVYRVPLVDKLGQTHFIRAFEVESITSDIQRVSVDGVLHLFPSTTYDEITRPSGPVDLLIGLNHASLHPTGPVEISGDLLVMSSQFGSGKVLCGTHPDIRASKVTFSHLANKARSALTGAGGVINNIQMKVHRLSFPEIEELGTVQPRRCESCCACNKCSTRAQEMSRKEQFELQLIESNVRLDPEKGKLKVHYPLIQDPSVLQDNRLQVIRRAEVLERRLVKKDQLGFYNDQLRDFIDRGAITEVTEEEMTNWHGLVNYVDHHAVAKPGSTRPPLRIVVNTSLSNNNSGTSYNDCIAKGPNSLTPLMQVMTTWRTYENVVVWDLAKCYQQMETSEVERHMRRIVWRWGNSDGDWKTYAFNVVTYGDRPASCALECGKAIGVELGQAIH